MLSREQAADYCGISPCTFDRAVTEGLMPAPKRIFGRVLWDLDQLDAALDRLPNDGARDHDNDDDVWDKVAV
jgi:predicted DNA-binding transcriptional regulator AlpA